MSDPVAEFVIPSEEELGTLLEPKKSLAAERADAVRRGRSQAQAAELLARDGEEVPWNEMQPLSPEAEPVPTMPDELAPAPLRGWLCDVAERVTIPLEFVAAPALVALGSGVGRSVSIRPMARDDWHVVPNLWGGVVGPPGVMKTSAIAEATRPIHRLAERARKAFEEAKRDRDVEFDILKARQDAKRKDLGLAVRTEGADLESIRADLRALKAQEGEGGVSERRFLTSDATIEKLGELLNENPRGLLYPRDELTGWLRGLDRDDRAQDRAFFLESWNGTGSFTVDRIGRGTIHVPALCLSVLGGIQPSRLRPYVLGTIAQDEQADGLLPRIQLLVWPDQFGEWRAIDRWPDRESRLRADTIFEKLAELDPLTVDAEADEFSGSAFLRFAPDAQALFLEWRHELERRLRSPEMNETPAFCQHLSKWRKLAPALALLFHLVTVVDGGATGAVSLSALKLALDWADFLELHVRKLYASELRRSVSAAHALARHIKDGSVHDLMTVRDITRREWAGLKREGAVFEAIAALEALAWTRLHTNEPGPQGGRPSDVIRLHPGFRATT